MMCYPKLPRHLAEQCLRQMSNMINRPSEGPGLALVSRRTALREAASYGVNLASYLVRMTPIEVHMETRAEIDRAATKLKQDQVASAMMSARNVLVTISDGKVPTRRVR